MPHLYSFESVHGIELKASPDRGLTERPRYGAWDGR